MRLIFDDDDLEVVEAALRHYGDSFTTPVKGIDIPELMSPTEKATQAFNTIMSQRVRRLWRIVYEAVGEPGPVIEVKDL